MRFSLPSPTVLPAFCLLGCLAASPVLRPVQHLPAGHSDDAIPVTSENAEYCARLRKNVDARLAAPPAAIPLGIMEDARHLRAQETFSARRAMSAPGSNACVGRWSC